MFQEDVGWDSLFRIPSAVALQKGFNFVVKAGVDGVNLVFRFSAETNRRDFRSTEANNLIRGGTRLIIPMLILFAARRGVTLTND